MSFELIQSDRLEQVELSIRNLTTAINDIRAEFRAYKEKKSAVMNIEQLANYLGKTVPSIRGLVARREISFSKVGGALSFTKSDIDNWINAKRKLTKAELIEDAKGRLN